MTEKVLEILANIRPDVDYKSSENFITDGLLDSLDIIRLVAEIDEKFNVSVNGADILPENFVSLDSIVELIKKVGNIEYGKYD